MAFITDMNHYSSSSNYSTQRTSSESSRRQNTSASAYVVDAHTMALTGFHYSTCGAGAIQDWGGWFEVPSGVPSPPPSPLIEGQRPVMRARSRSGDAAHNITEECERLLCETLKAVFLVEKDTALENSLVMDVPRRMNGRMGEHTHNTEYNAVVQTGLPTPSASPGTLESYATSSIGMVKTYLEMYDYTGGVTLRGLVAEKDGERALFAFFSKSVIGQDLKPGLTALLELAGTASFGCSQLVVCIDRTADAQDSTDLIKDLGWVGFELTTLDYWSGVSACTSEQWILLSMDV